MQDSNVLKVKELKAENKKLKSLITDLLKLSDNEFSILQDGIDAALSLLKIDPILRMRQGIDREAIKNEFKSHLAEKSTARKKIVDIDKLADYTADSASTINKKKTATKNNAKSTETKEDTSSIIVDSNAKEDVDEVEEAAGPLVGSRKKIEEIKLPEPKFIENNGEDSQSSERINKINEIIKSFRTSGPRAQAKDFLNKKSYASLFVSPKTSSLRDITKYYMILTKVSKDCDKAVVAPATNLMYNVLNTLSDLADEKFKSILQLKFEDFKYEGFKQAVDYVIDNIADYRDLFENYAWYMKSFRISFNEARTDLPLKKIMYGLSNNEYCSEANMQQAMNS